MKRLRLSDKQILLGQWHDANQNRKLKDPILCLSCSIRKSKHAKATPIAKNLQLNRSYFAETHGLALWKKIWEGLYDSYCKHDKHHVFKDQGDNFGRNNLKISSDLN